MMRLINAQLGKILLGVAVVFAIVTITSNADPKIDPVPESKTKRPVMVELDKSALAALSSETFFSSDAPVANTRCVFEPEKTVVVFAPVDLDIPPAGIKRSPQLLPEPGPSLEGTENLPRFGDEFPKVKSAEAAKPKPATPGFTPPATIPGTVPGNAPATQPNTAPGSATPQAGLRP